ncbi:MAG: non-heme iron oxygenase ferredoxin subunit [Aeromicrobium sp.]|uniref:non-heme iron oxygenase ferredoxin subunit n=1 Tax=Aeromicrobium sp. TaxID=1871063 RepID=UPI0039E57CE8
MSDKHFAAPLDLVPDAGSLAVTVDGHEIVLVRDGDEVFALRDECSHAAIPLSEGDVEGRTIECWLHGSRFDVTTGEPLNFPATEPVPTYPTTIEDDRVYVALAKEN